LGSSPPSAQTERRTFLPRAPVLGDGALFDDILAFFRKRGVSSPIKRIVVIQVERALRLVSPAYDSGATEEEVRGRWQDHWRSLEHGNPWPTGG